MLHLLKDKHPGHLAARVVFCRQNAASVDWTPPLLRSSRAFIVQLFLKSPKPCMCSSYFRCVTLISSPNASSQIKWTRIHNACRFGQSMAVASPSSVASFGEGRDSFSNLKMSAICLKSPLDGKFHGLVVTQYVIWLQTRV